MKLLRLRVAGFGPLRGEFEFDPERVTVIVDENERGKSSLLAAVTAALYGLENDRRSHRVLTPLDRWRPWDGGAFGVELELESGGERYSVRRDFERGTVEVWNDRGQELTPQFREGKDEFPVGTKLLGLGVDEFEKCAFVRQDELDQVVPGDEKARRNGTLHARLESAADTRGGDTNASEALKVLAEALKKYTCAELEFTGTVDNAAQRLAAKRGLLEAEVHALEHQLAQAAGPLERLAKLGEEEEAARAGLAALEQERRRAGATGVLRQLREDEARRAELAALRAEAEELASCAHLPVNAEAELRETLARHEEAARSLETLESRRRGEQTREREALEGETASLEAYASCAPGDADRMVGLAAEMRRFAEEDARLRGEVATLRDALAARGFDPERAQALHQRFGALGEEHLRMLRGQSDVALAFQTEVATLEQARTESTERLREIDASRNRLRLPGGFLLALGLGAGVAGVVIMTMQGGLRLWAGLLAGAAVLSAIGGGLLAAASATGGGDRQQALRRLSDAQRRLNQLKAHRAESEVDLAEVSVSLGFRDARELLREWGESLKLADDSAPLRRAHEQLEDLEARRRATFEEVRTRLDRTGGGPPDPAHLERVAAGIRHLTAVRQRLAEMDKSWSWIDEEKHVAEAAVRGLLERAMRILHTAGLAYDPARPWTEQVAELSARARGRERLVLLTGELIPKAERLLMPGAQVAELREQLAASGAEAGPLSEADAPTPRSPLELDRETRQLREAVELAQRQRADLKLEVDEVCRRVNAERPDKLQQIERLDRAIARAKRFKSAVELAGATIQGVALDTHRRWADWLNRRVVEILETFGTRVGELRFGEDLDFSVRVWNGQQLARGKAALQLSSGARDQLYLAIRLAISEYLSKRENPLPLLVDDAFSSSDDERARAGMRLLLEGLSARHQVVFATCHRQRLESFARLDPELYGQRVRRLDMGAVGATRS
jgi:DNA repair exonuclease SbcCD ATPase subunit